MPTPYQPMTSCFNPLHCGAVVASPDWIGRGRPRPRVSIPFIAGQWSLLALAPGGHRGAGDVSIPFIAGQWSLLAITVVVLIIINLVSIPFIAGQWSLPIQKVWGFFSSSGFNPLHCGAVVASRHWLPRYLARCLFQSPSLRGSGRFLLSF